MNNDIDISAVCREYRVLVRSLMSGKNLTKKGIAEEMHRRSSGAYAVNTLLKKIPRYEAGGPGFVDAVRGGKSKRTWIALYLDTLAGGNSEARAQLQDYVRQINPDFVFTVDKTSVKLLQRDDFTLDYDRLDALPNPVEAGFRNLMGTLSGVDPDDKYI